LQFPYLALLVGATIFGGYWARKRGKKPWKGKLIGFLIVTLPVFWDWPLTVLAHQYYCRTEAGFWVYKTLDQWKAENPGVLETLVENEQPYPEKDYSGAGFNHKTTILINERFGYLSKVNGPLLINVWKRESRLLDLKSNEPLTKTVDFYTSVNGVTAGDGVFPKFWLHNNAECRNKSLINKISDKYFNAIKGVKND
jgi:hypothetical protein